MRDELSKTVEHVHTGRMQITKFVLLAGSLLVGLSFAALLPPFEGFDEPSHYSYIEQLAQTGTRPRLTDPLAADVERYLGVAPSAASPRWSYRTFFAAGSGIVARGRAAAHGTLESSRPWRPAVGTQNGEGQHPPLYYALLAPIFRLSMGLSLDGQLILLRAVSYCIAWLGLCIVVWAPVVEAANDTSERRMIALAPALWPALFPMWFIEMGRLGNDSLVAFWAACAAVLLPRTSLKGGSSNHLALGVVCALGLLTKATFLPLVAAIFLFLCYKLWIARQNKEDFRRMAASLAICATAVVVIAGWWYAINLYSSGSLIGSNDEAHLSAKGSLLGLILAHLQPVSAQGLHGALFGTAATFLWTGSWSFIVPPPLSELPLAALVAVIAAGYVSASLRSRPRSFEWIYSLTLIFFIAGLVRQALIIFVETAVFSVALWYLHSFAPFFAPMLGRSLREIARWRPALPFTAALLVYPLIFLPFATGVLALYYAGCGDKYPGHSYYDFSSGRSCIFRVMGLFDNLSTLSNPFWSLILFTSGWILMTIGIVMSIQIWQRQQRYRRTADMLLAGVA